MCSSELVMREMRREVSNGLDEQRAQFAAAVIMLRVWIPSYGDRWHPKAGHFALDYTAPLRWVETHSYLQVLLGIGPTGRGSCDGMRLYPAPV